MIEISSPLCLVSSSVPLLSISIMKKVNDSKVTGAKQLHDLIVDEASEKRKL